MNSPASKVPSHGVRAYGQAYAIDIVADPVAEPRPEFGGAMMRLPSAYPAFGEPVFAMVDGEVVRASGWRRDHRARSNGWGIVYMMIEGMIRRMKEEIGRPVKVIATGGLAVLFQRHADLFDRVEPELTLQGLARLYATRSDRT